MTGRPPVALRVQVYELANVGRRESLLAVTAEDEGALRLRLRVAPPPAASHWDASRDDISVLLLGANLSPRAAKEFAGRYHEERRHAAWSCRLWDL